MDRAGAGSRSNMTVNPVQLQKYLGGIDYPTDKRTLIDKARQNGADDNVIDTLSGLDRDRFNSPNDVSEALGGRR